MTEQQSGAPEAPPPPLPPPPPAVSPTQTSGLFAGLHLAAASHNAKKDHDNDETTAKPNGSPPSDIPPPPAATATAAEHETPKLRNPRPQIVQQGGETNHTDLPASPTLEAPREEEEQQTEAAVAADNASANNDTNGEPIASAPVTDKLLGLLSGAAAATSEPIATATDAAAAAASLDEEHPEEAQEQETTTKEAAETEGEKEEAKSSSYVGYFSGWFGSSSTEPAPPEEEPQVEATSAKESSTESDEAVSKEEAPAVEEEEKEEKTGPAVATEEEEVSPSVEEGEKGESKPSASVEQVAAEENDENSAEASTRNKKEMSEEERQALDDAFASSDTPRTGNSSATASPPTAAPPPELKEPDSLGIRVHPDTPIPNSDVALRLLRRFTYKTRPKIITTYGGTQRRSIMSIIFGAKQDPTFLPYKELMDILYKEGEDKDEVFKEDSERLVDSVMGESGDSMARARLAVAGFVDLFSTWGHASSRYLEEKNHKGQQAFSELMSSIFEAASQLVAHGCLDGVLVGIRSKTGTVSEYQRAVHMLAQSVFNADLTIERTELAAMKFLLGAGCRVGEDGDALLRGSHLLQTIRTLYHVYLTTESSPNKTTARAALQQLTTSVFARVVQTDLDDKYEPTNDNFPSENHRDAFLVLRSICKLSMRSVPDSADGASHVGLQSSGSHETWDERQMHDSTTRLHHRDEDGRPHETAQLVYTSAIHPALESKLLALELILYVLQNTKFSKSFIHRSGPQFQTAIRNYLCVSLLKNCTSDNTRVVNLSLRIFVPLVRNFRTTLKNEIEAFVTNVFFVILDSKNTPAEHKSIVVKTFAEICSDPSTLAEIFLNYDCDLSAVDLFHRIVNTLSMVSRTGIQETRSGGIFMGSQSVARLEKLRNDNRELRLAAMKALRQVLASLHASIVKPMSPEEEKPKDNSNTRKQQEAASADDGSSGDEESNSRQSLVEIYGSKKKRREEEDQIILRFNRKPPAGIAYAAKCKHIDGDDPANVARYLLKNKDVFDKTQIGEYLGREAEFQDGFSISVLHEYVRLLDFSDLLFDEAIRFFLSGFRLPGEAQKIDRIMEKFAERFTEQNPDVFPTADAAFILAFSVIMLQTDLHNPSVKEERKMTKEGFIRNNRGICDGKDLPEDLLTGIYDRVKKSPFSLKEDDEARERMGGSSVAKGASVNLPAGLSPASFFSSHYEDIDRERESNFQKERDHIVRTTESLLKRRRHSQETGKQPQKPKQLEKPSRQTHRFVLAEDSGLKDEYVSPMFDVAWGPALAAFSTAMESANGTIGSLISIASDEELELAAENAAETIEVCLTGFRFAIGTAGLCGNETARDAFMLALASFSQLGTGILLEPRHIRCIQTMLSLAREDGELLGRSWSHVFRALSEINRFHQLFHLMARNDRVAAAAAERRRRRLEAREARRREEERRRAAAEDGESVTSYPDDDYSTEGDDSLAESDLFDSDEFLPDEEDMDARAIDEANARAVYDAVSEGWIEAIYERSSSLSAPAVKDFVAQLCLVSRSEISVGGGPMYTSHGKVESTDLTHVSYRQQHVLLSNSSMGSGGDQFHHSQPNIYNLQKLVEVAHYNMESRPRMIFADLWATIADHLTYTALHHNPAIAMYAVDSFRQLCIQYLQRDELEVFEFQRRFLKPLETVMAKSQQSSTKELLLNCVARLIHIFGEENDKRQKGGLKSGWVPILAILGLAGKDSDKSITTLSIKILRSAIERCLNESSPDNILLNEHFVETVNAVLRFVDGPHDEISLAAVDDVVALTQFLADESTPLPQVKRRSNIAHNLERSKQELELWWPILLGLSRAVGDPRIKLRTKCLKSLDEIVNRYFFPDETGKSCAGNDADENMQTLQLIFRGILTPILEFAETATGADDGSVPALPEDFGRFLSVSEPEMKVEEGVVEETLYTGTGWLETTFDSFLDMCIGICLRSIKIFQDTSLIDEVFAILNNCLLSDSGSVAVRGLRRLEQFVTSDIDTSVHSDDFWATVCHMLRRCLTVRGLPSRQIPVSAAPCSESKPSAVDENAEAEYKIAIEDFVIEDMLLANRRYLGSNATMLIGLLLTNEHFSISLRWRLFLIAGLGRGIVEWEQAAVVLAQNTARKRDESIPRPPDYRETALYGRKWMNRFLLQLASNKEIAHAPADLDPKTNRHAAGQKLVMDETQRLLTKFLAVERAAVEYRHTPVDEAMNARFVKLVRELLSGFQNMGSDHLIEMSWINPILLGSCIQCKNEDIRFAVQKLVQSTTPGKTTPYPEPSPKNADGVEKHESENPPTETPHDARGSEEEKAENGDAEASTVEADPEEIQQCVEEAAEHEEDVDEGSGVIDAEQEPAEKFLKSKQDPPESEDNGAGERFAI